MRAFFFGGAAVLTVGVSDVSISFGVEGGRFVEHGGDCLEKKGVFVVVRSPSAFFFFF